MRALEKQLIVIASVGTSRIGDIAARLLLDKCPHCAASVPGERQFLRTCMRGIRIMWLQLGSELLFGCRLRGCGQGDDCMSNAQQAKEIFFGAIYPPSPRTKTQLDISVRLQMTVSSNCFHLAKSRRTSSNDGVFNLFQLHESFVLAKLLNVFK